MATALTVAPSAERNKGPILEVLRGLLPGTGEVLEVASGTGQHVVHFAAALPGLLWQPSEFDPMRRGIVAARVAESGLLNVRPPLALDVLSDDWALGFRPNAVLAINLIHIAPWAVTGALMRGAARVLAADAGVLILYGPYKEGGRHTAPSNQAFDDKLHFDDPSWGVRDLDEVAELAAVAGFAAPLISRMPANNLTVAFRRARSASR